MNGELIVASNPKSEIAEAIKSKKKKSVRKKQ